MPITRGFRRRRQASAPAGRLPPGQYLVTDWHVLSAGPTPHTSLQEWSLTLDGSVDAPRRWSFDELEALPRETLTKDIHCVTKWTRLDMAWEGVSLDTLLEGVQTDASHVVARCDGGYTTNLPLADVTGGRAWVALAADDAPLTPEHGGPARLLVPHLYFWKSAKWLRGLSLVDNDQPGFWEGFGYHNYGDPWREQRYQGD